MSSPEVEPTVSTISIWLRVGTLITNVPEASSNCRVQTDLSNTTVTFGGWKSSGIAHAAAMMLR